MKKFILILCFYSISLLAIDSKILIDVPNTPSPWIVRAYYDNQIQLQKLSEINPLWQINKNQKYTLLKIENVQMFNKIKSLDIKVRLDHKLQKKYFTENGKLKPHYIPRGGNTIDGFSCYSTVEGTFSRMETLASDNSSLVEISHYCFN